MAMQFRRNAEEESSDESDEDYIPPERVEVEDDDGESGEADLEPSSGGDTDLDVGKRKRKRRMRVKAKGGKKKAKVDNSSDNNDETTSNETLVYLPLKATSSPPLPSSATDNSSSTPSPCPASSAQSSSHDLSIPSSLNLPSQSAVRGDEDSSREGILSAAASSSTSQVAPVATPTPPASQSGLSSMLAKLSGKKKQSTLEKSQLEWNKYKSTNALENELTQHNKGKGGFLDRQDFLQRANLREYETQLRPASKRSSNS